MNATQSLIINSLANDGAQTTQQLADRLGKDISTIRKNAKEIVADGTIVKDGKEYAFLPVEDETPADEPVELGSMDSDEIKSDTVPKRQYRRHDVPTTRTTRVNQITKTEVAVRRTDENKKEADKFGITDKYYTICITDGTAQGSERVTDAHFLSTYPTFCTTCAPKLEGKIGRRRKSTDKIPAGVEIEISK